MNRLSEHKVFRSLHESIEFKGLKREVCTEKCRGARGICAPVNCDELSDKLIFFSLIHTRVKKTKADS